MKFRHHDADEGVMPDRAPARYDDVSYPDCEVRWTRVHQAVAHYRVTLPQTGVALDDERYFALGMTADALRCEHLVNESPDRFGYARCARCQGHLWSATWVADDVFGDETIAWATDTARDYAHRLPALTLVGPR